MSEVPHRLQRKPYYLTDREIWLLHHAMSYAMDGAKGILSRNGGPTDGNHRTHFCAILTVGEYERLKEVLS